MLINWIVYGTVGPTLPQKDPNHVLLGSYPQLLVVHLSGYS
jgi:hypothetical protein